MTWPEDYINHVVCGDCLEVMGDCHEVMGEIPDKSVDMVFCDPPYGHNNNNWRWFLLILSAFVLCSLRLVNRDFYYDELYSLSNFLFLPLADIAGRYVNLNNHVLYSLVNAAYLKAFGIHHIEYILVHPWILRLPQVIFPLSTLVLVYRFGKRFLNERAAVLAALLLATTVPFYYYSMAIRGYGLSMMLMMGLMLCLWEKRYILASLLTAAFIYVMPSNATFVTGIGILCIRDKRLVLALGAGCVLAALLYAPLIPGILADPQTQAHGSRIRILTESIPETVNAFVSYRWVLLPVVAWGLYHHRSRIFWWALTITAVALTLFIIEGAYLWARVMFPVLPLCCLVVVGALADFS